MSPETSMLVFGVIIVFFVLLFWGVDRDGQGKPIIPRRKKPMPLKVKVATRGREEYIDSIRWKGEIYCQSCASPLKRVPWQKEWFAIPGYDPMSGKPKSHEQMYGTAGLMVCKAHDEDRRRYMYGEASFQKLFDEQQHPRHAMYYTDKPSLEVVA